MDRAAPRSGRLGLRFDWPQTCAPCPVLPTFQGGGGLRSPQARAASELTPTRKGCGRAQNPARSRFMPKTPPAHGWARAKGGFTCFAVVQTTPRTTGRIGTERLTSTTATSQEWAPEARPPEGWEGMEVESVAACRARRPPWPRTPLSTVPPGAGRSRSSPTHAQKRSQTAVM